MADTPATTVDAPSGARTRGIWVDRRAAIYGDAYNMEVMAAAMTRATHLIITLPHSANRAPVIATVRREMSVSVDMGLLLLWLR